MKKFTADIIFPVNQAPIKNGVVIVDDEGKILEIGSPESHSPEGVKKFKGAIIPGFVNTHCHLELSHMKNLVYTGTGLIPFISSVVKFRDFPEEQVQDAIEKADQEMWDAGIMAVGDISNKLDTARVKRSSKIDYYTFVEMFDFMQEALYQPTLDQYQPVFEGQSDEDRNKKSYVPHAPYSVGKDLFKFIRENNPAGSTVSIHNQETAAENLLFQEGKGDFYDFYKGFGMDLSFKGMGKSAIHYGIENLDKDQKTLFVHNTMTAKEDIQAANQWSDQVYWATCANANLYIENRLPDYKIFMEAGAQMTIGTDSLTSNWQLSILEEMRTIHRFKSYITFEELLKWATLNGAQALSYDDRLGSIEPGKTPGLLHLEAELIEGVPQLANAKVHRIV